MAEIGAIADPGPRRRYSQRPFPAYRYVPGVLPHPIRDPAGHSYGAAPARAGAVWRPEDWRSLDDWLYGVDLFNGHYFWEAHEAWEGLWSVQPRASTPALFVQGLIQIAAALLKVHLRNAEGVRALSREGLAKLRRVAAASPSMMGLDLNAAIAALEPYFADAAELADAPTLILVF